MIVQYSKEYLHMIPTRALDDIYEAMQYSFGELTFSQVINQITEGDKQIWIRRNEEDEHTCTVVTQVVEYPNKKTCEICYLGGVSLDDNLDELGYIEDWARFNGCDDIQLTGRKAWKKLLKDEGYSERYIILGKEL